MNGGAASEGAVKGERLVVVEGRVLGCEGARCTLEHAAGRAAFGGWRSARGGVVEVVGSLNPTEVACAVRCLPAPAAGEVLEASGEVRLVGEVQGGRWRLGVGEGGLALRATPARRAPREPGAPVWTGLPGVDVLAGVREGEALALVGADGAGQAAALEVWAAASRAAGRRVIWAGPPRVEGWAQEEDLVLVASAPGAVATLGRQVATAAAALLAEGAAVSLALVGVDAWARAWAEADGLGRDPRVAGVEAIWCALREALATGPICALLTLGEDAATTAAAALREGADGWVEVVEGALEVLEARSRVEGGAVARSTREILAVAAEVEGFAAVFGEEELSEPQEEVRRIGARLLEVLAPIPAAPIPRRDAEQRCVACFEG